MNWPTTAQVNAALRYAGTAASTIGAGAVLLGVLPADTAHAIVEAAQKVLTDLQQLVGDSAYLATLLFPVIIGILARIGVKSASTQSQVAAVQAASPATLVAAVKVAAPKLLIAAVQAMPKADVTVSDPKLAEGIPGVKVVPGS
jgi:hypothetical protein